MKKIKVIENKLGNIIKLLNKKELKPIHEVYISEVKHKKIKGWTFHKKANCKIIVIHGKIKFYLTKNFKTYKKITLSSEIYKFLTIKPKTWFRFEGVKKNNKLINFIDIHHDKKEIKKKKFN